jgi:hypothetical protein
VAFQLSPEGLPTGQIELDVMAQLLVGRRPHGGLLLSGMPEGTPLPVQGRSRWGHTGQRADRSGLEVSEAAGGDVEGHDGPHLDLP